MKQYANNTITNAILRIDFANPITSVNESLASSVRTRCLAHFEIPETNEVHTQEIQVNNEPGKQQAVFNNTKTVEWKFRGKSDRKILTISQSYLHIDFQEYKNFDDFKGQFLAAFQAFKEAYGEVQVSRMGLRYIDQIHPEERKTSEVSWLQYWSKYIDDNLLGGFSFANCDGSLAQHMNSCIMNYGDHFLTFQYGMFNPDYPAIAKKPIFVLDTDVYAVGLLSYEDIVANLDVFHDKASDWFERAITDDMRAILGDVDE